MYHSSRTVLLMTGPFGICSVVYSYVCDLSMLVCISDYVVVFDLSWMMAPILGCFSSVCDIAGFHMVSVYSIVFIIL